MNKKFEKLVIGTLLRESDFSIDVVDSTRNYRPSMTKKPCLSNNRTNSNCSLQTNNVMLVNEKNYRSLRSEFR